MKANTILHRTTLLKCLNVVGPCLYRPSPLPLLFLPLWWTWIIVLLSDMFCLSSVKKKCAANANAFPTHCLSGVYLSRTHQYGSASCSLPLFSLLPSHPATPSGVSFFFCSAVSVLLAFVVSKCCQLSPLSPGRWLSVPCVHPRCPSCSCCLFSVFWSFLSSSRFVFFSSSVISRPLPYIAFFLLYSSVLSFIHCFHLVSQDPFTTKGLEHRCICKIRGLQTISCGMHVEACWRVS